MQKLPLVKSSVYLVNGGQERLEKNQMKTVMSPFYNSTAKDWSLLLADLSVESGPEQIDVLISTTCGEMLFKHGQEMQKINQARKSMFRLICVQHHTDPFEMQRMHPYMRPWAEWHKLVFVGLSEQYAICAL